MGETLWQVLDAWGVERLARAKAEAESEARRRELVGFAYALQQLSRYVRHINGCSRENMAGPCNCGLSRLVDEGEPLATILD